jgi:hypothetical protein
MIESYQLLCVVTVVETVCNGGGLWGGVVIHNLDVGCPAIANDTNPPNAMSGGVPSSEDDFTV